MWVVIDTSAPHLPHSAFFQPVLSGDIASKIRIFEGILLSSKTLGKCGGNNSDIRSRGLEKPMMYPEGISIIKGEVIKITTFIKLSPETIPLLGGDENIYWLYK